MKRRSFLTALCAALAAPLALVRKNAAPAATGLVLYSSGIFGEVMASRARTCLGKYSEEEIARARAAARKMGFLYCNG